MKKIIPCLISIVCLYLVFRKMDFKHLMEALLSVNLNVILVSSILLVISLFFKFQRWKVLLLVLKKDIKNINIFSSMVIGVMGDHVLPAKAGEFIRSYLVGTKENISKTMVFGTVIIERMIDVFCILIICGIALVFIPVKNQLVIQAEIAGVVILVCIFFAIFLVVTRKELLVRIMSRLLPDRYSQKIENKLEYLSDGLRIIKSVKQFIIVFLWSLLMWSFIICSFLPVLYAFDYGSVLPAYTVFVLLLFVAFGLSIPSSPGGIGIYEYACFLTLQFCLPRGQMESIDVLANVGAFTILFHFTQVVPELIFGIIFFMKEGLRWSSLSKMKQLEEK